MKTTFLLLLTLLAAALPAGADIEVRLAVKFIQHNNGAVPTGTIANYTGFEAEVKRGNGILDATGRGYRLRAISYAYIQPPLPDGQAQDYWYNLDARSNRAVFESAALGDFLGNGPNRWQFDTTAINIFVNNSSSGQCSFVGNGLSISLGGTVGTGTVLHEIGHFFNLSHTHSGDPVFMGWVAPNPLSSGLGNGDGLVETLPDHPFYTLDQLSLGNYGVNYAGLNAGQRFNVDNTFYNVMSYHNEDRLLDIQMDHWAWNANMDRSYFCNGYTVFVAPWGNDVSFGHYGYEMTYPLATVGRALDAVLTPNDVILLTGGNYTAPAGDITKPCTLTATRGAVTLTR